MVPCMEGQIRSGMPVPSAVVAKVVTGVSSIPQAIFERVLAVAGQTRTRSTAVSASPQ